MDLPSRWKSGQLYSRGRWRLVYELLSMLESKVVMAERGKSRINMAKVFQMAFSGGGQFMDWRDGRAANQVYKVALGLAIFGRVGINQEGTVGAAKIRRFLPPFSWAPAIWRGIKAIADDPAK